MWLDTVPATSWAFGWFLLCAAAFYWGQQPLRQFLAARQTNAIVWLLAIALFVRLLPIVLLPVGAGYDIESFLLVGRAILAGQEVYTSEAFGRHPYLPMQMYLIGAALWAARHTFVPFVVWIKLPGLLADVGITAVIFRTTRQHSPVETAQYYALLYAFNPISLLVTAYHGQFDAVAVLLLLLAWHFYQSEQQNRSALALGFAILNKTWPVVFLPITFIRLPNWRSRLTYALIAVAIPVVFTLLYIIIFAADPTPMLRRALTHSGVAGYWGHSAIVAVAARFAGSLQPVYDGLLVLQRPLLLLTGLTALWFTRSQTALNALVTIILAEFAVSVGMGIQWLLWVVPFAILSGDTWWLRLYSFTGSLFLLGQLYGLHMYPWAFQLLEPERGDLLIRISSIPAWVTVVLWAWNRLRLVRSTI
ncbi:MAG: DUF2029 domain-containing protein [Anaerolineales bacterium]|nr:DUF2029 domain-containing protein [Anaerolineales bacterium]